MMSREAFEQWISSPPYEHSIKKYPDDATKSAWPKCYRDITVQIAWDAWQERERQFMQTDQYVKVLFLLRTLRMVKECLSEANEDGVITDTIWYSGHQTLFDFIDEAIDNLSAAQEKP